MESQYARAMGGLHAKEFGGAGESLYTRRGHSADSQVQANYTVWTALSVLEGMNAALWIELVSIAGPGQDFAPGNELFDGFVIYGK